MMWSDPAQAAKDAAAYFRTLLAEDVPLPVAITLTESWVVAVITSDPEEPEAWK
jgi:hypothetical protein